MEHLLDARGLACPLPLVKARAALAHVAPGDTLVVLATDPEAPVDLGALATDEDCAFEVVRQDDVWRIQLVRR